jgi:hypothetical protein
MAPIACHCAVQKLAAAMGSRIMMKYQNTGELPDTPLLYKSWLV